MYIINYVSLTPLLYDFFNKTVVLIKILKIEYI